MNKKFNNIIRLEVLKKARVVLLVIGAAVSLSSIKLLPGFGVANPKTLATSNMPQLNFLSPDLSNFALLLLGGLLLIGLSFVIKIYIKIYVSKLT